METRSTPAFLKIQRYHHQHHYADLWRNNLFKFASSFFLKNLSPIKSNFKGRFQCISLLVAPREINQPPAGIFFVIRKGWPRIPSSQKAQVSTTCCSPGCQLPHSELLSIMIDWTRSAWIRERFIFDTTWIFFKSEWYQQSLLSLTASLPLARPATTGGRNRRESKKNNFRFTWSSARNLDLNLFQNIRVN